MIDSIQSALGTLRHYAGRPILNSSRLFPDLEIGWRSRIGDIPSAAAVQSTWGEFQHKIIQQAFSDGSLKSDFLRADILKKTVSLPQYRIGQKIVEKLKADDLGKMLLLMVTDPPFGQPYLLPRYPLLSSVGAQNIYYLVMLNNLLATNVLTYDGHFVDFGGGYGYFSRAVVTVNDKSRVHIVDLPIMSVIQRYFHQATLSPARHSRITYHDSLDMEGKGEKLLDAYPWLLDAFHFNATFSLSECSRKTQISMLNNIVTRSRSFLIIYASHYNGVDNEAIYNDEIREICKYHEISHHRWHEYAYGNIVVGRRRD